MLMLCCGMDREPVRSCNKFRIAENPRSVTLYEAFDAGVEDAVQLFGVDEAFSTNELSECLNRIADKYPDYLLFYDLQNCSSLACNDTIVSHIKERGITVTSVLICNHYSYITSRIHTTKLFP